MSRNKAKTRVRSARGRKNSSTLWLQRQLNDPYVYRAQKEGYRGRAAFKLKEIDEILWILSESNPADALTKKSPCAAMDKLLDENVVELNPYAWVERKKNDWEHGKISANLHTVSDDLRDILVSVQECTDIYHMRDNTV